MLKAIVMGAFLLSTSVAQATVYNFSKLTSNNVEDLSSQLSVDVSEDMGGALFTFTNNVGIASSIADIYFDNGNGNYLTNLSISAQSSGVSFSLGANPTNLPGGNVINFTADLSADSNGGKGGGVSGNGINSANESLTLMGTGSFSDVINGLNSGDLKIGLHVQSIGVAGGSEGYVTSISAVPEASNVVLMAFGFGLFGLMTRRKRS